MPVVLAIEPDIRQAAILKRIVKEQVRADLVLVDSRDAAVSAITARMPDVILVTALLSPRDEEELIAYLRSLEGAEHLQTHTIPQLASTAADIEQRNGGGGLFGKFLRKKDSGPIVSGCDPDLFAGEIRTFIERASEQKADTAALTRRRAARLEFQPVQGARPDTQSPPPAPAPEQPVVHAESAWASPFEWRPSAHQAPAIAEAKPAGFAHETPPLVSNVPIAVIADDLEQEAERERAERERVAAEQRQVEADRDRRESEAEAIRQREEDARTHREEEERQRLQAEVAARRKREEEERLLREEERKRLEAEGAARRKRDEEERRRRDEEDRRHLEAEAAGKRKREEEARKRLEAEAAAKRKRDEEERRRREEDRKRLEAEAAAKRKRDEEERRRREEERKRLEAEAAARRKREEEERRRRLEEERKRLEAEAAARRKREEEERRRRLEEEERTRLEAEATAHRRREEEERRQREEAERKRLEAEAAARRKREEEERRQREEEERKRLEAEVAARRKRVEEERRQREEAERARLAEQEAADRRRQEHEAQLASRERAASTDPFAEFRAEHDEPKGLLKLMPVSTWARAATPRASDGSNGSTPDDASELISALHVPPQVALISYAHGCRIRRVRVRAQRQPKSGGPKQKPLILSRRALEETRSEDETADR